MQIIVQDILYKLSIIIDAVVVIIIVVLAVVSSSSSLLLNLLDFQLIVPNILAIFQLFSHNEYTFLPGWLCPLSFVRNTNILIKSNINVGIYLKHRFNNDIDPFI